MTDRVSLRAGIPPFYVMDVWLAAAERQRSHGDLVNLSAGQPSVGAPEPVRAAAAAAVHSSELGYSVALGIPGRPGEGAGIPGTRGGFCSLDSVNCTVHARWSPVSTSKKPVRS